LKIHPSGWVISVKIHNIVELRMDFVNRHIGGQGKEDVEKEVFGFIVNDEFEELDDKPRIMLVAREFRPEVTASVLWLRKFGMDVSCVKLTPYKIDAARLALVSSTIIPLPEAEEYIVKSEKKESPGRSLTRSQEEYLEFFKNVARALGPNIGASLREPTGQSIYAIPTGTSGIHFEFGFHGRPRDSMGVELHFETAEKERNLKFLREMERYRDEIERTSGEKVVVQEDWGKAWSRLYLQKQGGQLTEELRTWAVEKMTILYKLLQPKIMKLP